MQDGAEKEFRLALGSITKLIDAGKEKGYLTYDEANDLIPYDVYSPEHLDDVLATAQDDAADRADVAEVAAPSEQHVLIFHYDPVGGIDIHPTVFRT